MPDVSSLCIKDLELAAQRCRDHIERVVGPIAYIEDYCEAPDIFEWLEDDGRFDDLIPVFAAILREIDTRREPN